MKKRSRIRKADWSDIMEAARKTFRKGNRYGVCAFGIDRKARAGLRTSAVAFNVYVNRKLADPKHHVPALSLRSRTVYPDVVGLGDEACSHHTVASRPAMLGLYPGAAIRVAGAPPEYGGIACMLGDEAATHFLTAGHLFPRRRPNVDVVGGLPGRPSIVIGRLVANLLEQPYPSMEFPIDVALVRLTPAGARVASTLRDGPALSDFVPSDETGEVEVKAFLPTAHDYSRPTTTLKGPLDAQMYSPLRGPYFVRQAIGTEAMITHRGDSGTILCDADSGTLAIGICVGQLGAMSVFEPVGRALALFRQNTDLTLDLV